MEKYTIDELLDVLQWARDRAAYYRACNKRMPGALYAADCKAERDAEAELYRADIIRLKRHSKPYTPQTEKTSNYMPTR